jgi:hypothetical protein
VYHNLEQSCQCLLRDGRESNESRESLRIVRWQRCGLCCDERTSSRAYASSACTNCRATWRAVLAVRVCVCVFRRSANTPVCRHKLPRQDNCHIHAGRTPSPICIHRLANPIGIYGVARELRARRDFGETFVTRFADCSSQEGANWDRLGFPAHPLPRMLPRR